MESWPGVAEAAAVGSWPATMNSYMARRDIEIKLDVTIAVGVVGDHALDSIDVVVARAVRGSCCQC